MDTRKITEKTYLKMKYFTKHCDKEISGLGKVKYINNELIIYDAEIFKQNVSSVHSTLDVDTLALFLNEKLVNKENIKDYKVWWHSHADMKAYFSQIDEETINQSTEFDYLISIVMNKYDETEARLDIFKPTRISIPLEIKILLADNKVIEKQCKKEIKEKVKTSIFADKSTFLIPKRLKKKSR